MAAVSSFSSLFENPLPENPTLIESLSSWNNHHKHMKPPIETSTFAEIFGELYFQEKPHNISTDSSHLLQKDPLPPPLPPPLSTLDSKKAEEDDHEKLPKKCCSFSSSNKNLGLGSLEMCTEGLGSESSVDVDDLLESGNDWRSCGKGKMDIRRGQLMYSRGIWDHVRRRSSSSSSSSKLSSSSHDQKEFPPPISSIGKSSGKPWMCLKSYREDGRFVLREIRIPNQDLLSLHASRQDGRLKLHFVRRDLQEDIADDQGEGEGEEDGDGDHGEEEEEEDDDDDEVQGRGVTEEKENMI